MKLLYLFLEQSFSLRNFPLVFKYSNEQVQHRFEQALAVLNKSIEAKQIVNPEYQNLKHIFNGTIERVFDQHIREQYFNRGKWESLPRDIFETMVDVFPSLSKMGSVEKKVNKLKDKHQIITDLNAFVKEFGPLSTAMESLKGAVVKKVKKSEAEKEQEKETQIKEHIAHKDVKKVYDLLVQITKQVRDDAYEANLRWIKQIVARWQHQYDPKKKETSNWNFYGKRDSFSYSIVSKVTTRKNNVETLKDDYKKILEKEAKRITDEMLDRFVVKNTEKLARIVTKKNNLKTVELVDSSTARGVVEGYLRLEFKDKSGFDVNNKVVFSHSKYGKPFYRFPTTFHNVTLPDGSKMKGPSETKMNNTFAKS